MKRRFILAAALLLGLALAIPFGARAIDLTTDLGGFSALQAQGLRDTYIDQMGVDIQSTMAELDAYPVYTCIADVSTAQSDWVVAPHAGDITGIWTVIDGTIATAPAVITLEIAGTLVTGSTVSITHTGSVAGDVDSATPTGANTVTAGQAIEVITSGASTNTVEVCVTLLIDR